jgi:hypothetical protein
VARAHRPGRSVTGGVTGGATGGSGGPAGCSAGARTLSAPGSVLYPETGNGGYTSVHTLVHLVYDATANRFLPGNRVVLTDRARDGAAFTVTVNYTGRPGVHNDGDGTTEGWFRAPDGGFVTTEPVASEDWMPLNDYPTAKPNYDFSDTVTAGAAYIALRQILGPARFDAALRQLQRAYGGASVSEAQLEAAFARWLPVRSSACQQRLSQFFTQWFDTAYPPGGGANRPMITGPGLAGPGFASAPGRCG